MWDQIKILTVFSPILSRLLKENMLPYYRLGFMSFCPEDGGSRPCIPPKCWNCRQNYTASQPRTLIVIADVTGKATSHSGSAVSCSEFDAHRRPHSAAGSLVWLTVWSKILFENLIKQSLDVREPRCSGSRPIVTPS